MRYLKTFSCTVTALLYGFLFLVSAHLSVASDESVSRGLEVYAAVQRDMQENRQNRAKPIPPQPPSRTSDWAVKVSPGISITSVQDAVGATKVKDIIFGDGAYYLLTIPGSNVLPELGNKLRDVPGVVWFEQQIRKYMVTKGIPEHGAGTDKQEAASALKAFTLPKDPQFRKQWYHNNTGQAGGVKGVDVKSTRVWPYATGRGMIIGIVDDGVEYNHLEFHSKYAWGKDYDFLTNVPDGSHKNNDGHGTCVAGIVAAKRNDICGVGVAYGAKITSLRLIGSGATDQQEADAMAWLNDAIQIKNNSWGPSDNGATLASAGYLMNTSLIQATTSGRNGLGTVFVWAAGNGNLNGDYSGFDGYASNMNVIAVAALTHKGVQSVYSERGANILVTAPGEGS